MRSKKLRDLAFSMHRYIGLIVGLLFVIVGLTGSVLAFQHEIDHFLTQQQFGLITPQSEPLSIDALLETVKTAYANQPELKLSYIRSPLDSASPYLFGFDSSLGQFLQVFVNPYTGKILGSSIWETSTIGLVYRLHYQLLAGDTGMKVVGVAALLLVIICMTGIALWPGWNKLIAGFKIKWNAHPKRVNFDIHKVAGIIAVVFLTAIAFTGFCWNFYDISKPAIYAITSTPVLPDPISKPALDQPPLALSTLLAKADDALPTARTTYISLPQTPEGIVRIGKKQPQELSHYGFSRIYLDQYTGEVVRLENGMKPTRAEAVLNAFVPLHHGTFGGWLSRILYVFVGLTPLILFSTGLAMGRYRKSKLKS
jgi:uncharacterized iron-regulated membrane protein